MGVKFAGALAILLAASSIFGIAVANKNCTTTAGNYTNASWGQKHKNAPQGPNRIIVGGSEKWRFGYNYTDWAIKNGPFYFNDTLVFKYDLPNDTTAPHNVYLLPDLRSFQNCDFKSAVRIAGENDGAGEGFQFVLKKWQPHYFACAIRNGVHCNVGLMKFAVLPLIRWYN